MKKTSLLLSCMLLLSCLLLAQEQSRVYNEFQYRMQMTLARLTGSNTTPVYTPQFVLADVDIDTTSPRRFFNFSGDLSGRYVEVMSMVEDVAMRAKLEQLVKQLITYQRPDGRFGNAELVFTEDKIGGEHMALLWGNGRLLVGLMQYYKTFKDPQVLQTARRLGDFITNVYGICSTPAVAKRLEGMMAQGIICFTQCIEGMIMLSQYSSDPKYASIAGKMYKVLGPRGNQHTHGYLSTLRGVLMLYDYNHDETHLNFVKNAYDDLVQSTDYTPFGGVREYFGHMAVDRDEGCSTADFVRLSFDLYRETGQQKYLQKGEFGLLNALYFNQYYTGDFGHHLLNETGSSPDFLHAAWWCCTMHGLRAMYEIKQHYLVDENSRGVHVNLYLETTCKGHSIDYELRKMKPEGRLQPYSIKVTRLQAGSGPVFLRMPEWAAAARVWVNEKSISIAPQDGYLKLPKLTAGDAVKIGFQYKVDIQTPDRGNVDIAQLTTSPVAGYLHYGPWLLGADDKEDATFTAEPNENIVYINPAGQAASANGIYSIRYKHAGFPSNLEGRLRPVSALTFDKHGYLMTKLVFATGEGKNTASQAASMLAPFDPRKEAVEEKHHD